MKKITTLLFSLIFIATMSFSQEWEQTGSTPEGAGVTELIVNPDNHYIFVTTASFNWPNGDDGGVRRSMDDGDSWENVYDAYAGRTITLGADGYLYASIWPYPQDEGLYRSTDNGSNWQLLVTVPTGNNIFSTTVSTLTNPTTIFAGTRNGVYRSEDNGTSWAYSSTGIPANSWVRDIEVDSNGVAAAATHSGLFISDDNGDTWQQATGDGIENDTITKIIFDYPFDTKDETRLIAGSGSGTVYESFDQSQYLVASMMMIFGSNEVSGVAICYLHEENKKMHNMSEFPEGTQPSGFRFSADNCKTWQLNNSGLTGNNPKLSALSARSNSSSINLRAGLFQNSNGGALVFRITYDWSQLVGVEDNVYTANSGLKLHQNFPNPFNSTTDISFYLKNEGHTSLKVYTLDGRLVKTVLNKWQREGTHIIALDAENMGNGIYFYKLESEGSSEVRKMIVFK